MSITDLRTRLILCFVILIAFVSTQSSYAANITFQDTFQRDDQIALFSFVVDYPALININSIGYAGAPTSDFGVIPAGGFDTYLTLFDFSGVFIAENDDGESATIDPATGSGFDAQLVQDLLPGTYLFALTQYGNYALGGNLSDGFSQTGNRSYTNDPDFAPGEGCPAGLFKDVSGTDGRCRTGNYVVAFFNDQGGTAALLDSDFNASSATPEPSSLVMLLFGSLALGFYARRNHLHFLRRTSLQSFCKTREYKRVSWAPKLSS